MSNFWITLGRHNVDRKIHQCKSCQARTLDNIHNSRKCSSAVKSLARFGQVLAYQHPSSLTSTHWSSIMDTLDQCTLYVSLSDAILHRTRIIQGAIAKFLPIGSRFAKYCLETIVQFGAHRGVIIGQTCSLVGITRQQQGTRVLVINTRRALRLPK